MKRLTTLLALLLAQPAPSVQVGTAVLSGHVRMIDGSPASGVRVALIPMGSSNQVILRVVETDAAGAYRLEIPAGRYYLTVGVPEFPTFFPGVQKQADAKTFDLADGAFLSALDFTLSGARLRGRLTGIPQTVPPGLLTANLFQQPFRSSPPLTATVGPGGEFEFTRVAPGYYSLMMRYEDSMAFLTPQTPVRLDGRDVTNLVVKTPPFVFGRVTLEGSGSLGGLRILNGAGVTIRRVNDCCASSIRVRSDGWFLAPLHGERFKGDYQVYVSQLPFGLYVYSIGSGGVDLLRSPLTVKKAASATPIEITLTSERPRSDPRGVRVSGRITGAPAPLSGSVMLNGGTVDIRSAMRTVDVGHFGTADLAPDGSFTFENAPPGDYEFIASSIPRTFVMRSMAVPGHDVDRLEVQLSEVETAALQGTIQLVTVGGDFPQIPIPPEPISPKVTAERTMGSLVASQSGRGPLYVEGAYSYFLIVSNGAIVEEKRLIEKSVSFSLPAGIYELRAYLRPCDGNCGNLDPPTDECRAPFTLKPGETLAVNKSVSDRRCTLRFSRR